MVAMVGGDLEASRVLDISDGHKDGASTRRTGSEVSLCNQSTNYCIFMVMDFKFTTFACKRYRFSIWKQSTHSTVTYGVCKEYISCWQGPN